MGICCRAALQARSCVCGGDASPPLADGASLLVSAGSSRQQPADRSPRCLRGGALTTARQRFFTQSVTSWEL